MPIHPLKWHSGNEPQNEPDCIAESTPCWAYGYNLTCCMLAPKLEVSNLQCSDQIWAMCTYTFSLGGHCRWHCPIYMEIRLCTSGTWRMRYLDKSVTSFWLITSAPAQYIYIYIIERERESLCRVCFSRYLTTGDRWYADQAIRMWLSFSNLKPALTALL